MSRQRLSSYSTQTVISKKEDMMRRLNKVTHAGLCLVGALSCGTFSTVMYADPSAQVYRIVDNWEVDGQHGILRVQGSLTDSPCRLEMHSRDQTIELGSVGVGDLSVIGSEGRSVSFQLALTDCLAVANARMNRQTGQVPWSRDQPGVAIRFLAEDTDGTGRYVKAKGITGLGLVIKDAMEHPLALGQYSSPRLLPVGQSMLTYTVTPVRVASAMSPGSFYAVIGFQLSYD